jgi:hypothetical protein
MSSEQTSTLIPENVTAGIQNVGEKVSETIGNAQQTITSTMNEFAEQSQAGVGASSQFLQSNSLIAKVIFILLVLIGFLILLSLGTLFMTYLTSPPANPYLVNGVIDGTYQMNIQQDPSIQQSIYVQRSNNQNTGIEFTWSFWIFVKGSSSGMGTAKSYQHVFNKGNANYDNTSGLATVNNAPGVYLSFPNDDNHTSNKTCELTVLMDTVKVSDSIQLNIPNIPMQKWVHVALRMQNTILDVYVNGTINSRSALPDVPKQNYDNVNICNNGGFSGNLSNLRYYNYALNVFDINSIVKWGPNLKVIDKTATQNTYYYLSRSWYSYNK